MLSKKIKDRILKISVLIGAYALVYFQIKRSEDISSVKNTFVDGFQENWHYLFIVILLTLLNWSAEGLKWRFLLKKIIKIKFFRAFKSVMSGVTIGMFTPNRLGEFAGRIVYLENNKRAEGAVLSLIGSFSQFFTTILFGIPALFFFILNYSRGGVVSVDYISAIWLSVGTSVVLMILYFNLHWVYNLIIRFPFLNKYRDKISNLKDIKNRDLIYLLIFSIFRYSVFITQFYLISRLLNIDILYWQIMVGAANIYFLMSMLPVFTLGEPGLRASLTGMFFVPFTLEITSIISASVLLWLINVLFVALLGALFMLNQKIINYESKTSG